MFRVVNVENPSHFSASPITCIGAVSGMKILFIHSDKPNRAVGWRRGWEDSVSISEDKYQNFPQTLPFNVRQVVVVWGVFYQCVKTTTHLNISPDL